MRTATRNASKDLNDHYWVNVKLGSIVHYINSKGRYVRCEVVHGTTSPSFSTPVTGKVLRAFALVGTWPRYDLPHYDHYGEIKADYYARRVLEGNLFRVHYQNIYESFTQESVDPRTLPPLDLNPPPMTKEQEANAVLYRAIRDIRDMTETTIENKDVPPIKILLSIRLVLNRCTD